MLSLWHDTLTSIYRILVLRCEPDGEVVFHQLMELMLAQLDSYLATAVSMNSCHFSPRNRQLWSSNEKPAFVCIFVKTKAPLFQNISEPVVNLYRYHWKPLGLNNSQSKRTHLNAKIPADLHYFERDMIVFIKSTVEDRIDKVFPAFNPTSQHLLIIPFSLAWIWLQTVRGLMCLECIKTVSASVCGGVWSSSRCQPGRVSPPCERVGDVWVWSSRRTPCRTRRRRARGGRGCGDASSWPSYPWTSLCSPGDQRESAAQSWRTDRQVMRGSL